MNKVKTEHRRNMLIYTAIIIVMCLGMCVRLVYLMVLKADYYTEKAINVQQRERKIKAPRGQILDRNGTVIASNKTVCTVSIIHNQITDSDRVINVLSKYLKIDKETIKKKVLKISSIEKIKSNVPKKIGDRIRKESLDGVKVDEDYKRYYPYQSLASKVLGFTGADNQGIVGLEVKYDEYMEGTPGAILTQTDFKGIEVEGAKEGRLEPVEGNSLVTTIDINVQKYAQQIANNALKAKQAKSVSIIVMNPNNGEILAMVNAPEYNLNKPYKLLKNYKESKNKQDNLNKMWRNQCINDTYEPGSTFKVITETAALSENIVNLDSRFFCPGYRVVEDRRIRCHKITGHGSENLLEGTMNSCNPVFIDVGLKLGPKRFYKYLNRLGILDKTGIDLPGEAGTIIHKIENVGQVELATMSFGQSFQITPMRYLTTASAIVNGGRVVTPHFAKCVKDADGNVVKEFEFDEKEGVVTKDVSETIRYVLSQVVANGTGSKGQVEEQNVGGKTATSQKLPRNSGKYIASYMSFAPVDNPKVIAMALIDEPKGIYYGGQIAAPLISDLYTNILPYILEEYK